MICGIDPGAHGAIAILSDTGALIAVHDMPTFAVKVGAKNRTRVAVADLSRIISESGANKGFVERVGAMPGQGVSSCFSFGYAAGAIEGVLAALDISVTFVTPQSWKKAMQVRADKDGCRQRAAQLFPSHSGAFSRVKDDGRAEAAMIGLYGLQSMFRQ